MEKKKQQDGKPDLGKNSSGRLTPDRIQRLEDIGFVWSVRDDWNKHYEELKLFRKEHGHCNVPARHSNRRLGVWVSSQRQLYKLFTGVSKSKRRTNPLTQERIDKLNALNFTWAIRSSSDSLHDGWNRRMAELKDFKESYGHCLIPSQFDANPELGFFAESLRRNIKIFIGARQQGRTLPDTFPVTDDRLRQLADLEFLAPQERNFLERNNFALVSRFRGKEMESMMDHDLDSSSGSSVNDDSSYSGQVSATQGVSAFASQVRNFHGGEAPSVPTLANTGDFGTHYGLNNSPSVSNDASFAGRLSHTAI